MKSEDSDKYFDENQHVNHEGRTAFVKAILMDERDRIAPELSQHVADCMKCAVDVSELLQLSQLNGNPQIALTTNKDKLVDQLIIEINENGFLHYQLITYLTDHAPSNPRLERRLETVLKSMEETVVIRPESDQICIDHLDFEFERQSNAMEVTILDAEDKVMEEHTIPPGTATFRINFNAERYSFGAYYWMLSYKKNIQIGRFYIYSRELFSNLVMKLKSKE